MSANAILVFSGVSCVQASVWLNPVRTFFFSSVWWNYSERRQAELWRVCWLCEMWHVLRGCCLAQLLELPMRPRLGAWCARIKADGGLSGSWCCVSELELKHLWRTKLALWRLASRVRKYWLALSGFLIIIYAEAVFLQKNCVWVCGHIWGRWVMITWWRYSLKVTTCLWLTVAFLGDFFLKWVLHLWN